MGWVKITGKVVGAEEQVARLTDMGPRVTQSLRDEMTRAMDNLKSRIASNIGTNFQRHTGKMQRAVYGIVRENSDHTTFTGVAGVAKRAYYAAFFEKGASHPGAKVRGYTATSRGGDVKEGRRKVAVGVRFVSEYTRDIHVPQRSTVGAAYDSLYSDIVAALERAVRGG